MYIYTYIYIYICPAYISLDIKDIRNDIFISKCEFVGKENAVG